MRDSGTPLATFGGKRFPTDALRPTTAMNRRVSSRRDMSLKKAIVAGSFVILASAAAPAKASADWLFTPFLGATFGGSANVGFGGAFKDEFERNLNYGASLAGIGS